MEPARGDGAEELLHTYTEDGGINYLAAAAMLPSRSAIDDACAELMSLMFPGFSRRTPGGFERSAASDQKPIAEFALAIEAGVLQKPWQISSRRHRRRTRRRIAGGIFFSVAGIA